MKTNKFLYILLLSILLFLISSIISPKIASYFGIEKVLNEPILGTYTSDEQSYLKIFYLIKKGVPYYNASKLARDNYATGSLVENDIFTWRLPTVFYIWSFFANSGLQIFNLFIFFTILALIFIILIIKKLTNPIIGFLSTLILIPYIYTTLNYKTAFLFTEWWGLFFFIVGLYGLVYKYSLLVIVSFTTCLFIRELYLIPILTILVLFFLKKENYLQILLPLIFGSIFYIFHSFNITNIIGKNSFEFNFFNRFHNYSLLNLQTMLSFSMQNYAFFGFKTHFLILGLGLLSIFINYLQISRKKIIVQKDKLIETNFLLIGGSIISMVSVLPMISIKENDYWGILFVPLILICVPLGLNILNFKRIFLRKL